MPENKRLVPKKTVDVPIRKQLESDFLEEYEKRDESKPEPGSLLDSDSVELTHVITVGRGARVRRARPSLSQELMYIGNCMVDGDLFASTDSVKLLYKGKFK